MMRVMCPFQVSSFFFSVVETEIYATFFFLVNCWPSPSNDGTCEVSIEYELEKENVTLYDVIISIPLPCVSVDIFLSILTP